MKKLILALGMLLTGVSVVSVQARSVSVFQAQQNDAASKRLESIKKACNLSPDQTTKVQSLLNDYEATQAANEKANKGNAAGLKEANKKNSYDFNQKLAKVLTPEQLKALNTNDAAYSKEKKAK
ncbi:MAG TPA: hypothetical protein VK808_14110 [Bacteroidia bacterium]|nr:hypothetical protein [Bacteroidia bacterium]